MGPHEGISEGDNLLPPPAATPPSLQPRILGLPGCKSTLLIHVQLFIHPDSQVILGRAALKEFSSRSVHISGIAVTQSQPFTPGLFELIRFLGAYFASLSRLLWMVPLLLLLYQLHHASVSSANLLRLHAIPLVYVIDKDTKTY